MPITLNELMALRDKQMMSRIDALIERRAKAEQAITDAHRAIADVDQELAALGIRVDIPQPAAARPAASPRAPRAPREVPGERRTLDEYVDVLDSIGRELDHMGRGQTTGPELVKAMAARGFPSKLGVMRAIKNHERWIMTGSRRGTRYTYQQDGGKRTRK